MWPIGTGRGGVAPGATVAEILALDDVASLARAPRQRPRKGLIQFCGISFAPITAPTIDPTVAAVQSLS